MTYSPTTRDRYRVAVSSLTGAAVVGALTATGWLAGLADRAHSADLAQQQATAQQRQRAVAARAARVRARYDALVARRTSGVVYRQRPTRTRVTTRYVSGSATSADLGGGGTVSAPTTASPPPAPPAGAAPAPAAPPPPPPPPAPAAPSTGS